MRILRAFLWLITLAIIAIPLWLGRTFGMIRSTLNQWIVYAVAMILVAISLTLAVIKTKDDLKSR